MARSESVLRPFPSSSSGLKKRCFARRPIEKVRQRARMISDLNRTELFSKSVRLEWKLNGFSKIPKIMIPIEIAVPVSIP